MPRQPSRWIVVAAFVLAAAGWAFPASAARYTPPQTYTITLNTSGLSARGRVGIANLMGANLRRMGISAQITSGRGSSFLQIKTTPPGAANLKQWKRVKSVELNMAPGVHIQEVPFRPHPTIGPRR